MKILLLDISQNRIPSVSLLKAATFFRQSGNEVHRLGRYDLGNYDEIYISFNFSFDLRILRSEINQIRFWTPNSRIVIGGVATHNMIDDINDLGAEVVLGRIKLWDESIPDYDLAGLKYSIARTSIGCPNSCKYCIVPKFEGAVKENPNWQSSIKHKRVLLFDNNWLAKGLDIWSDDVAWLAKEGITIDPNQGLDCRIFSENHAKIIKDTGLNFKPFRFAFDSKAHEGFLQNALELCAKYDIAECGPFSTTNRSKHPVVYVLYNFKDQFSTILKRIRVIVELGGAPFPMRYVPHDAIDRSYISDGWTRNELRAIRSMTSYATGVVSVQSRDEFDLRESIALRIAQGKRIGDRVYKWNSAAHCKNAASLPPGQHKFHLPG